MKENTAYSVALFDSVSHVMKAEKALIKAGVVHKIIPVPRKISTDCGVCIRFFPEDQEQVEKALSDVVAINSVQKL
jgi:hypothetical protein